MKISIGAVVRGGTSLDYQTGTWRDRRPVVKQENCKACGICEEVCPDGAVELRDGVFQVDYFFCKGCGLCARECPAQAIEVIPEEK